MNRIYDHQFTQDHILCPFCRVKTLKKFKDLPKSRHILQYLENLASNQNEVQNRQLSEKTTSWNKYSYLKKIWNGIKHEDDSKLTEKELNQALKNGFPNSEFKRGKLKTIFLAYDKDKDKKIDFDEFCGLFSEINENFDDFFGEISRGDTTKTDCASNIPVIEEEKRLESKQSNYEEEESR